MTKPLHEGGAGGEGAQRADGSRAVGGSREADGSPGDDSSGAVGRPRGDDLLLVLTTLSSPEEADVIGRALVGERLAACVNVLGACRSIYRWQGEVEQADEFVLLIKTTRERYSAFEERLRAMHPYELPEIVALAPDAVLPAYAAWVAGETEAGAQRASRSQRAASSEK